MAGDATPISALLQGGAAAVGAGVVIGGFLAGLMGLFLGSERTVLEQRAVKGGYVGGLICVVVWLLELIAYLP